MTSPEKPANLPGPPIYAQGDTDEVALHKHDIFFAAIELTRMPMLVTDPRQPDNPIIFANRAFVSMTGYELPEIVGHNCRFLQGPATDRSAVSVLREAIAARREVSLEILNYRKDGSTFWNALFVSPVLNRAGELVYFFASQLDVSRRRDAEEALAQAQKMEALGQLTGGISHDFNNLLQVMSGHIDLLDLRVKRDDLSLEHISRSVSNLRDSVSKASKLTAQLLAFSRKQSLTGRVVNLNSVVRGMSELVSHTLGETVEFEFEFDEAIGNTQLDATQLEVALLNVLVNARDAMPDGGTITIKTKSVQVAFEDSAAFAGLPPGRYVCLSVSDTGVGIDSALLARVMEPFFTTKDEGKGTGLGLSMVHGFVKQSGGTVTMYSEIGTGTTVKMYFPTTKSIYRPQTEVSMRREHRGGTERILVVEDRGEVGDLARDMLEGLGYSVLMASNGQDALDKLRAETQSIHMLFSDIIMPGGMNGYVLAREVQRLRPTVKVLLTTGFDRNMGLMDPISASEFDVISKPYRLADLARRVRLILDGETGSGPMRAANKA